MCYNKPMFRDLSRAIRPLFVACFLVWIVSAPLLAEHLTVPTRRGHFFLPSRTLFFFRPDLYVHRYYGSPTVYGSRHFYGSPHCRTGSFYGGRSYGVYGLVLNGSVRSEVVRANTADLVISATPARALVYVDDKLIGSAGDFSTDRSSYTLIDGKHHFRVEFPGYEPFEAEMQVMANRTLHLDIQLEPASDE